MTLTFQAPIRGGKIGAIPSKSAAHRQLICAAFADAPTEILCSTVSEDITATARCLTALGATITRSDGGFTVIPAAHKPTDAALDCGESGSTLRFLLPVTAARGIPARFIRRGRLPYRPLSPLYEEMIRHGADLPSDPETEPLPLTGQIRAGRYEIDGGVSSQFVSGLLMAMPLMGGKSELHLTGNVESADYIRITTEAMNKFGVCINTSSDGRTYTVRANGYTSPKRISVEGDWSNAAIWLAAGAVGQHPVTVTGLDIESPQGDRRIVDVLRQFGATVTVDGNAVTVAPAPLNGICLNASQIPDLVPVIAAVAARAEGETRITGIARLRIKESDRVASVTQVLRTLGADIFSDESAIVIRGGRPLAGGTVSSFRDHRLVMCAFVASLYAEGTVFVTDAQAINKSYPDFTSHIAALGGQFDEKEDVR
ncbi:MAG: 3-phosphoshikimate 1-carboxyvinyltransferase [Clostridia bacterium]|nr:3-phosphoshikimate 1-carboxyvinyltransferase [Clostridia bacterium]